MLGSALHMQAPGQTNLPQWLVAPDAPSNGVAPMPNGAPADGAQHDFDNILRSLQSASS